MNKEQKKSAATVIKAYLSVKINGRPTANEIVAESYRRLKGKTESLEEFIEIMTEVKKGFAQ